MLRRRTFSGVLLSLLFVGMLTLAFNIKSVKAELKTIIVPDNYPTIQEAINAANEGDTIYVRKGIYPENIIINKSITLVGEDRENTIIDGGGSGNVITIQASNVNISNFTIRNSDPLTGCGIYIERFGSVVITNSNIKNNNIGIQITLSSRNQICENMISANKIGIQLFYYASGNTIRRNVFVDNNYGIDIFYSINNMVYENVLSSNYLGVSVSWYSKNNVFYHNNFINNTEQAYSEAVNTWDNGYPSGGNYWNDYSGVDLYSGPYQNITGSDGIGDTPYIIDSNNVDRYPLMNPWQISDVAVTNVAISKTIVGQGYTMNISVTVQNQGDYTETFNVTLYANTTEIETREITLTRLSSTTLTFTWNTSGFAKGNYTIWAYAWPVPGETDTEDNTFVNGIVLVNVAGDVSSHILGVPDYIVNARDVTYLILLFGARPNSQNWNPNADINNDGVVNARDITIAVLNFMKTFKDP